MNLYNRRYFLGLMSSTIASMAFSPHLLAQPARPNVLFISIDDLNDWIGPLNGYPGVLTPNLDRLASFSTTFTNAYCSAPACNPSRSSLWSGIPPHISKVYNNQHQWEDSKILSNSVTMPQYFKEHGYNTFGGGKLFHAQKMTGGNLWNGYHHSKLSIESLLDKEKLPLSGMSPKPRGMFDFGSALEFSIMPDAKVAKWATKILSRSSKRPTFLGVGFYRPHLPWIVPQKYFDMYPLDKTQLPPYFPQDLDDVPPIGKQLVRKRDDHQLLIKQDKWKDAIRGYLASITFVDECLGIVLDALEAGPMANNTMIVLWSDHGWHLGEKLSWRKFTLWERATRVPLFISQPGQKTASQCTANVNLLDLYPTMLNQCFGHQISQTRGIDLSPLLANPAANWQHPSLTTWGPDNHALRIDHYRYIKYADGTRELYDHQNDPNEWYNLIPDAATVPQKYAALVKNFDDELIKKL